MRNLAGERDGLVVKSQGLRDGFKEFESNLERFRDIVERNEYLTTIVRMIGEPGAPLDWTSVRKASVVFLEGFLNYLEANKRTITFVTTLIYNMSQVKRVLTEGVRYEFRTKP